MFLRGCPCCTAPKIDQSTNRQIDRRKCLLDKRNYQKRDFKSLVRPCKGADRSGTRAVGSPFRYRHMQAHPRTGTRICASSKKVSVNLSGEGGAVGGRPEFALASTVRAASTWRVAHHLTTIAGQPPVPLVWFLGIWNGLGGTDQLSYRLSIMVGLLAPNSIQVAHCGKGKARELLPWPWWLSVPSSGEMAKVKHERKGRI